MDHTAFDRPVLDLDDAPLIDLAGEPAVISDVRSLDFFYSKFKSIHVGTAYNSSPPHHKVVAQLHFNPELRSLYDSQIEVFVQDLEADDLPLRDVFHNCRHGSV